MDYSAEVRRRFEAALAAGSETGGRPGRTSVGEAEDRALGVWARARIDVLDGRILAAAFDVYGCPDTIAAAQLAAEQLRGAGLAEFHGIDARAMTRALGIPIEKLGKLLRLEDAVVAAVEAARLRGQEDCNDGDITD